MTCTTQTNLKNWYNVAMGLSAPKKPFALPCDEPRFNPRICNLLAVKTTGGLAGSEICLPIGQSATSRDPHKTRLNFTIRWLFFLRFHDHDGPVLCPPAKHDMDDLYLSTTWADRAEVEKISPRLANFDLSRGVVDIGGRQKTRQMANQWFHTKMSRVARRIMENVTLSPWWSIAHAYTTCSATSPPVGPYRQVRRLLFFSLFSLSPHTEYILCISASLKSNCTYMSLASARERPRACSPNTHPKGLAFAPVYTEYPFRALGWAFLGDILRSLEAKEHLFPRAGVFEANNNGESAYNSYFPFTLPLSLPNSNHLPKVDSFVFFFHNISELTQDRDSLDLSSWQDLYYSMAVAELPLYSNT